MTVTLQQQYKAALEARGKEVTGQSRHFLIMSRAAGPDSFYFLGHAGALRVGFSLQRNWPVKESFKQQLLGEFKALEAEFLAGLRKDKPGKKAKEAFVL